MIRCVGFDFDGTLVDSNAIKRNSFFEVFSEDDPDGETVAHVLDEVCPGDRYDIVREVAVRLRDRGAIPTEPGIETFAQRRAAAYTRLCEKAVAKCPEIPGATATLEWLVARGLPIYVNSATPQEPLRRVLELRSLARHFRLSLGRPADKRENLATICADAGVPPQELLFVGDGEDDRSSALAFGCPFAAVVRPGPNRFAAVPTNCIADLHALPTVVERLQEEIR
ncbi:MAG: HAD family hydrolase [Deltaproteobacteria bacterium]|nr:HAD family hydrolase [Deltaproteobacteria bacterium]